MNHRLHALSSFVFWLTLTCGVGAADVELTVDVANPSHGISPRLVGVFFEDINFGADGGLSAELVKNGGFEFPDALMGWHLEPAEGRPRGVVRNDAPWLASNANYLRLRTSSTAGPASIINEGFRGMGLREDETYHFTAWASTEANQEHIVEVALLAADGKQLTTARVEVAGSGWQEITAELQPSATELRGSLRITLPGQGTVDLDQVSLCPEHTWRDRPHGLRADLVQLLADMKPAFFRFPGGCIVEGRELRSRYQWKTTIGDLADRRLIVNRWNTEFRHRLTPDYYQSFAVGFFEYFQLAEDIGAEPLPILNCGMACQFNSKELVPMDELAPYIQDALDLIEFANGPVTSAWGAKRAALGHPEPFNMRLLGVGNEQWDQQYIDRYREFQRVLKEKHPEIELVSGAGPFPNDEHYRYAWPELRALGADIVDEHCYAMPDWFLRSAHRYDGFERNGPRVFMGEYAAQSVDICSPNNRNNLRCALAEAAFLTGIERNSDVVTMSSYAPLFGHEDAWQWRPNLIWFDNLHSYATPNYYVQQLFSLNKGDRVLPVTVVDSRPAEEPTGRIGLATFESSAEFKDIRVERDGETLFTGDQISDLGETTAFRGNWSIDGGVYRQSDARGTGRLLFGDQHWSNTTLSLKARKLGGREGFLVIFRNSEGGSFVEWNLGGSRNTKHGVQAHLADHSTDRNVLAEAEGTIETDRWYDVRIELSGAHAKCFLDGALVHEIEIPLPEVERVYATASRESTTGDVIVKVVNCDDQPAKVRLQLSGLTEGTLQAVAIVLEGSPDAQNSIEQPNQVVPTVHDMGDFSADQTADFPAYSFTVLRLRNGER